MNSSIVLVHFQPLEAYPPVMNLINHLGNNTKNNYIFIITTKNPNSEIEMFTNGSKFIRIVRLASLNENNNKIFKSIQYLRFYLFSFFCLIIKSPSRILYYETLSSFPVFLYFKFLKKNVEIFIHYHEYMSQSEYLKGMKLVKYFHYFEKYLYKNAKWISHTNLDRLNYFKRDESIEYNDNLKILSNYPPQSWLHKPEIKCDDTIKVVYVGALSLETMYVKEFVDWILLQNGKVILDIYSTNITYDTHIYIANLDSPFVNLKAGTNYFSLPSILVNYNVGVILYKGHTPNYIYNAPNKLFEYLALGLDVWFPEKMLGCKMYISKKSYPKVFALDFENMSKFDFRKAIDKSDLLYYPSDYFCEKEFESLTEKLLKK